jgi:hypothetical protein
MAAMVAAMQREVVGQKHQPRVGLVIDVADLAQLREDHRQILVPTGETAQVRVAAVSANAFLKLFVRQVLYDLREYGAACVHAPLFRC